MHLRHLAAACALALSATHAAPAPSWLQANLPPQTAAYLRLPSPWFLENHALPASATWQNDSYRAQTATIRSALVQKLIAALLPPEAQQPLQTLQQHLDAPLEIALLQDKNELNLLIGAHTAIADEKALQQTLAQIFPAPWHISADTISQPNAPAIAYRYDAASQRLLLSTGMVKDPAARLNLIKEDGGEAPFTAQQSRLDPNADGLYLWLDPQNPLIQMKTREWQPVLQKLGLDRAQQLALAWSENGGRPRLQLALVQPDNAPLNLPKASATPLKLRYQGELSDLAAITLPNDAQIEGIAQTDGKAKQLLQQTLGISADDLAALGTIYYLADDNGYYLVLPQSAKPALDALLGKLQQSGALNKRETLADGIEHLAFTSLAAQSAAQAGQRQANPVIALMRQLQNHYYLRAEGDYLLISDLPQPLLARKTLAADAPTVADWLAAGHIDLADTSYAWIHSQRHLSRDSYYNSLKRLQVYADLAGQPLDLISLPDAGQLPASGTIALRLHGNGTNPTLTLDLQNGLDDLLSVGSGSTATIAAIGVISAIVLPTYHDYVVRSHIARNLAPAGSLQHDLAEAIAHGKKINTKNYPSPGKNIRVEASGDIRITLENADKYSGATLTLHYDRASKAWQCQTVIPARYLPPQCR